MKHTLPTIAACLLAMALLSGCGDSGSGLSSLFNFGGSSDSDSFVSASLPGDGSGDGSGNSGGIGHMPEPATLGLLGSGLLAYALLRRKKKK